MVLWALYIGEGRYHLLLKKKKKKVSHYLSLGCCNKNAIAWVMCKQHNQFLRIVEAGSLRMRYWQIWHLVRALVLVQRWLSCHSNLMWPKGQRSSLGSLLKALTPHDPPGDPAGLPSHDLIASQPPPPNTIILGIPFQLMNFVGKQIFNL